MDWGILCRCHVFGGASVLWEVLYVMGQHSFDMALILIYRKNKNPFLKENN
jgi:hypothetical protein